MFYKTNYCILRYAILLNVMREKSYQMKPQDVVLFLKIIAINTENWQQNLLADELKISLSKVSKP